MSDPLPRGFNQARVAIETPQTWGINLIITM